MEKLVLIDGHSIMNRAFYGVPDFTNSKGIHTNAVFGFLNIMFKIIDLEKPDYMAVAFDVHAKTFRHEMYEEYKGTRKPMLPELREQIPLIKDVLVSMGIKVFEKAGFEADDILGTLSLDAQNSGKAVTIISGDRDLLQLASKTVKILIPKTKKGVTEVEHYYDEQVVEKYKVTPTQFIDVKALMGDSSDNIPGVPGIGEKTATNLISQFGSIDGIYENIHELKNNRAKEKIIEGKEAAYFSRILVTIKRDVPLEYTFEDIKFKDIFTKEAFNLIKEFEFKSLYNKFDVEQEETNLEKNFKKVIDFADVNEVFENAYKQELVGVSLAVLNDEILACGITFSNEESYYIPSAGFVTPDLLLENIRKFDTSKTKLSMIDVKSDLKVTKFEYSKNIFDVSVATYLINPLKDTYAYDDIARDILDMSIPSKDEIAGKTDLVSLVSQDEDKACKILCFESSIAYLAVNKAISILDEMEMKKLYLDIEMPLLFALNDMENAGVIVEKESLEEYSKKLGEGIDKLENSIYKQAGEEFNINSPKQLGVILFEKLGLPGSKKTKTGYSTSAAILEKLQEDYPIVKDILEYRQLTKLKSTYADGLVNYISEDGRIHGHFNQTITATGRISSTEPNLQNIPIRMELGRQIRKVFVPKEGCVFIDADYSQIELRILAHMSDDDTLIEAYNKDEDIHKSTAAKVFNVPIDEVTPELRSNAKAVNFGIVYGISSFGLSQDLSISKKEADKYIKDYFKTYPKIKEFLDNVVNDAKENGYSLTMFGRRRPVPELASSNFMQRSFGERIAMNSPIQGTAADIMKIAMINVAKALKEKNLKSKIVIQVHDELLIETYKDEVDEVKKILRDGMCNAANLRVPLNIGIGTGDNWYEAH